MINPRLVYARGHGQGARGPDAEVLGAMRAGTAEPAALKKSGAII